VLVGRAHGVVPGGEARFGCDVLEDDRAGLDSAARGDGAVRGVVDGGEDAGGSGASFAGACAPSCECSFWDSRGFWANSGAPTVRVTRSAQTKRLGVGEKRSWELAIRSELPFRSVAPCSLACTLTTGDYHIADGGWLAVTMTDCWNGYDI